MFFSECSYLDMTRCFNPLIKQSIFWPNGFDGDTDWSSFYDTSIYYSQNAGLSCR